jgi:ubiquinone/menaquinone biosynthesis C-methylase UbiE
MKMNNNEKYSIKKYDQLASDYDSSSDGKFTAKYKAKVLEICNVSDGDGVLDVGCGNGSLINEISQKSEIKAYGIDISPNMIKECRKRYGGINFEISNGEGLNFEGDSFDVLTICCVLHHLNNPQKFFWEANRVLKAGGTLIVAELWLPFGIRQLADYIVFPLLRAGDNKIFTHKGLKQLFCNNGFAIAEIYKKGLMQVIRGRKS